MPGLLPALGLLVNAFVWGVSWWPLRHLEGLGLHPLWSTALIYGAASLVVLLWRPAGLRALASAPALWVILLASGATNACFNWAVTVGDVTRVVLLFYLAPLWMVLLARWLLAERLTPAVGLRVALALAGAAMVLVDPEAVTTGGGVALADVLALLGGMGFALFNVMLRREAARPESHRALAMFLGGLLVPGVLAALASQHSVAGLTWPPLPVGTWVALVLALGLAFLLANLALQYGAARLTAQVTAVIMPSEVVFAAASAAWLAGEAPSAAVLGGGALILLAAALAAWPSSRPSQPVTGAA